MRKIFTEGAEPMTEAPDLAEEFASEAVNSAAMAETALDVAAAKREAAEHYDRFLRTRAELENVLRRQERERIELSKYAAEALARDILNSVDDLERAIEHSSSAAGGSASQDANLMAGVELVRKGLLSALEKHGVVRVASLGKPFDPSRHEAVAMVDADAAAPNTVVAEHRPGYLIGDRLLRPAMVVVARPRSSTDAD
jgi:molecular chaperone GrpE